MIKYNRYILLVGNQLEDSKQMHTQFVLDVKYWPHCIKYFAYLLNLLICLASGFFTLLYGLSLDKKEQGKWLISFFAGVFEDVLVNQPIKVCLLVQ